MTDDKPLTVKHGAYASKFAAFRADAQGPDPILNQHTGAIMGHKKSLAAEFGVLGPEQTIRDEEGIAIGTSASIRGFHWDSRIAQAEHGWTDEETQAVIDQVEYFCRTQPDVVWRTEAPVLTAPWPTFDTQPDANVVAVAIEIGQVEQALAYARQAKRKKVVSELEAHLSEQAAEVEAEESLTAV